MPKCGGTQRAVLPLKTAVGLGPVPTRPTREGCQELARKQMKRKVGVLHPCILQHDPHSSSVPCFGSWPPKRARRRAMSPPRHLLHPQFSRRRAVVGLGSPCCGGWIPPGFPPCLTLVQDQGGSPGGTSLVWPMAVCTHRGACAHTRGFGNIPNTTTSLSHPLHLLRPGLGYFFSFLPLRSPTF